MDREDGRGETTAVPKGAKEGVVNGSGCISKVVDADKSGKCGMITRFSKSCIHEVGKKEAANVLIRILWSLETHLPKGSVRFFCIFRNLPARAPPSGLRVRPP